MPLNVYWSAAPRKPRVVAIVENSERFPANSDEPDSAETFHSPDSGEGHIRQLSNWSEEDGCWLVITVLVRYY